MRAAWQRLGSYAVMHKLSKPGSLALSWQVLRHLGSLRGYSLVDLEVPHPFDML